MATLQNAIGLIKAGDRDDGRRILAELLSQDPSNESAWLWMSSVVEQEEQRQYCLKQVLKHNPGNKVAQAALARLQGPKAKEQVLPTLESAELPARAGQARDRPQAAESGAGVEASQGQAAVWQAPPPPAHDPAMMQDMAAFVIDRLAKHESVNDIVPKLCEVSGMSWSEAKAFVERVEEENRREIAGRQRPILVLVGAISVLIGAYLAYNSASYLAAFAADLDAFSENPLFYIFSTPQVATRVITLELGAAIVIGGLWGTVRALMPPGQKSLLEPEASGEGSGSVDDFIGIHVSLGDETISSSGWRRKRL